jgi:hypothetical protein
MNQPELGYFNNNDMNILIDIGLEEIQRQKNPDIRYQILNLLETIIKNE